MSEGGRHHLHELAEADIPLAIDDFGTGYSALSHLLDMPFDALKVDRSFVTRLPSEPHVSKVMHVIVAMAHALDMTVVAEGVETQEEFDQLVDLKCDQIQGYLNGRPMPAADLDALLHCELFNSRVSCCVTRGHSAAAPSTLAFCRQFQTEYLWLPSTHVKARVSVVLCACTRVVAWDLMTSHECISSGIIRAVQIYPGARNARAEPTHHHVRRARSPLHGCQWR